MAERLEKGENEVVSSSIPTDYECTQVIEGDVEREEEIWAGDGWGIALATNDKYNNVILKSKNCDEIDE